MLVIECFRCDITGRTRHDVASIHCIFILDEAEAIHQLDLGDLTRAMGAEVFLDVVLGRC